jgi:hypothetical protein
MERGQEIFTTLRFSREMGDGNRFNMALLQVDLSLLIEDGPLSEFVERIRGISVHR